MREVALSRAGRERPNLRAPFWQSFFHATGASMLLKKCGPYPKSKFFHSSSTSKDSRYQPPADSCAVFCVSRQLFSKKTLLVEKSPDQKRHHHCERE